MTNNYIKLLIFACLMLLPMPAFSQTPLLPCDETIDGYKIPDQWEATAIMFSRDFGERMSDAAPVIAQFTGYTPENTQDNSMLMVKFYNIQTGLGYLLFYFQSPDTRTAGYTEGFTLDIASGTRAEFKGLPTIWSWLGTDAKCAGESELYNQPKVQWYKSTYASATVADVANWVWFDHSSAQQLKLPLRIMDWESTSERVPILRDFGMAIFTEFTQDLSAKITLQGIYDTLQFNPDDAYDSYADMAAATDMDNIFAEYDVAKKPWIFGLKSTPEINACNNYAVPEWPNNFHGKAWMNSVKFSNDNSPYRASVFFDQGTKSKWTKEQSISTRLQYDYEDSEHYSYLEALLIGEQGRSGDIVESW